MAYLISRRRLTVPAPLLSPGPLTVRLSMVCPAVCSMIPAGHLLTPHPHQADFCHNHVPRVPWSSL